MAWAERYTDAGHGLGGPGAERYATRAERNIGGSRRNAIPMPRHGLDGLGGTLYRCQGVASVARAERYATRAERSIDGSRRNAIPMPGRGLDDPGAERYATGTGSCRVSCGWPLVLSSMR